MYRTHAMPHAGNGWSKALVLTRLTRGVLAARWSSCGRKLALGSASKQAAVCHFDASLRWWSSKLLPRKHHTR